MDWIVEVKWEEINSFFKPMKTIYRTCPACQDKRVVKASEMYDGYCPKCGQKMERPDGGTET